MSSPKCLIISTIGASRVVSEDPSFINIFIKKNVFSPAPPSARFYPAGAFAPWGKSSYL